MDILYRLSGRSQNEFFFHIRTRVWRPRSVTLCYSGLASGLAAVIDRTTHAWLLITWLFSSSLFTLWCGCVGMCCADLFCWIEFYFCNIHSLIKEIELCCFLGVLGSILWHVVTIRSPFLGITRHNAFSQMAKIYRVIEIKSNQLVQENVLMINDLPTKRI